MEDKNTKIILNQMNEAFSIVNRNIENLAVSTQEQFSTIEKKFDSMDEKFDSMDKKFEGRFNVVDIKMNQIHHRLDEVIVDKVNREEFSRLAKRVEELENA
jgi:tetrahydromethanopterin S-methyltransferase subunit G